MADLMPYIVTEQSFDETGTFREAGSVGYYAADAFEDHLIPIAPGMEVPKMAIAAVGPTGPNPQLPQQIPPDAFQLPDGYGQPLSRLVPEIHVPIEGQEELPPASDVLATPPEEAAEQLAALKQAIADKAEEVANEEAAVENEDLSSRSDEDLEALRRKEINKSRPRRKVLSAIDAERGARADANYRPAPTQLPAKDKDRK